MKALLNFLDRLIMGACQMPACKGARLYGKPICVECDAVSVVTPVQYLRLEK